MAQLQGLNVKLTALEFQGDDAMKVVVGHVTITGGASLRGFSLMFTEIEPRTATQYEVNGPASATTEMIGKLIRANLALNHADSVEEWDLLQFNLKQSRQGR